ncbi:hypothetical protein SKAU_G00040940 [Synaphobranchus kaupii]|uniref:Uncharacterized protein n=1 Tax=Synaphobranchus kaupii TaxID=118154 RepID=A0A9Q1J6M4_SYNKA|nr:hypothetical protein SKAU_G00040940 [Synaphobranchus kaupii]
MPTRPEEVACLRWSAVHVRVNLGHLAQVPHALCFLSTQRLLKPGSPTLSAYPQQEVSPSVWHLMDNIQAETAWSFHTPASSSTFLNHSQEKVLWAWQQGLWEDCGKSRLACKPWSFI